MKRKRRSVRSPSKAKMTLKVKRGRRIKGVR